MHLIPIVYSAHNQCTHCWNVQPLVCIISFPCDACVLVEITRREPFTGNKWVWKQCSLLNMVERWDPTLVIVIILCAFEPYSLCSLDSGHTNPIYKMVYCVSVCVPAACLRACVCSHKRMFRNSLGSLISFAKDSTLYNCICKSPPSVLKCPAAWQNWAKKNQFEFNYCFCSQ